MYAGTAKRGGKQGATRGARTTRGGGKIIPEKPASRKREREGKQGPEEAKSRKKQENWIVKGNSDKHERRQDSSEKPKSTWEILLPIWDLDDRPEAMQHEATVNSMSLENAFSYKAHFEQQAKKEGKGEATFGKDKKLSTRTYSEEKDNCAALLHSVRFERGPVVEESEYWDRMPLKRKETYRHLALENDGCENKVNENVITRAHDRSLPLRIRMFTKNNYARKGFGEKVEKEPAAGW